MFLTLIFFFYQHFENENFVEGSGEDYTWDSVPYQGVFRLDVLKSHYEEMYPSEKFSKYETVSVKLYMID